MHADSLNINDSSPLKSIHDLTFMLHIQTRLLIQSYQRVIYTIYDQNYHESQAKLLVFLIAEAFFNVTFFTLHFGSQLVVQEEFSKF